MSHRAASASSRRLRLAAAVGLVAPLLALTLAACNPMDVLEKVQSEEFGSRADAEKGWVGVAVPAWIPADATKIKNTATNNETNSVIAVEGGGAPEGCEKTDRVGLPFDSRYGSLGEPLPTEAFACGPYEVLEAGTGWLGWFNAREEGQTPDDLR
ncbi:hypothetical protein ACIGEP_02205 [Microbacterium sp. NPDC077663]|uniref:hypothetical protein n=1 Tax=Microbacterium sp. NPDC077663 TaxID=3364189 RepID=UPI0037C9D63D